MKKYYQIFNNWELDQAKILKSYGVNTPLGFQNLKLDEEVFIKLESHFKQWGAMVTIGSEFSSDDLSSAPTLMVLPNWQTLYPQPENNFSYLEETYDLTEYCQLCGIGAVQKKPFRIKNEIKWGKKQSFILNWIFDEIFVSKVIYEKVFLPNKIKCLPVLTHKNGKIIENVVQLVINEAAEKLNIDNIEYTKCASCDRKKYTPITNGYFPNFTDDLHTFSILKSQEYYGSGKIASHWIIVSQSFSEKLLNEKINFTFYPSSQT